MHLGPSLIHQLILVLLKAHRLGLIEVCRTVSIVPFLLDHNLLLETIVIKSWNINISLLKFSIFFTVICFLLFINAANMYDGINLQSGPYFFGVYSYLLYQFGFNIFFLMILIVLSIFCLSRSSFLIF
jgi:UDP-N-acetylmuramyl pentapeptide phosphotransferase/UDP-N-acetylglucosamine-1-phosphate transferase